MSIRISRVLIERSKTNKESVKIEETYFPKIRRIFKHIVREYEGKLHFLFEAEKRYGPEIKTLIKSMVTKSYLLAMEYVARATGKPEHISLSPNDVTQIMLQSDESYRAFWRLVTKYLQVLKNRNVTTTKRVGQVYRHKPDETKDIMLTDELFSVSDWEDDRLFDLDTNTELVINGIVTTTLALATYEKFKEFRVEEQILLQQEEEEETALEELFLTEGGDDGDKYVWATEKDERVCDLCESLEGQEWSIDDPSILIPRQDSHPRCRCRLLLKLNNKIINK